MIIHYNNLMRNKMQLLEFPPSYSLRFTNTHKIEKMAVVLVMQKKNKKNLNTIFFKCQFG